MDYFTFFLLMSSLSSMFFRTLRSNSGKARMLSFKFSSDFGSSSGALLVRTCRFKKRPSPVMDSNFWIEPMCLSELSPNLYPSKAVDFDLMSPLLLCDKTLELGFVVAPMLFEIRVCLKVSRSSSRKSTRWVYAVGMCIILWSMGLVFVIFIFCFDKILYWLTIRDFDGLNPGELFSFLRSPLASRSCYFFASLRWCLSLLSSTVILLICFSTKLSFFPYFSLK